MDQTKCKGRTNRRTTEHFEDWSEANHRWFVVNASRVGGPGSPLVTIVYNDMNDRKTTKPSETAKPFWPAY